MLTCDIIIPTRDRPEMLRRAVTSALAALPIGSSIVVVDDGGTIPARESLADLLSDQLVVIQNEGVGAGGGSPARNRGVEATSSEVIFFLDDDDKIEPGYLSAVLTALENEAKNAESTKIEKRGGLDGYVDVSTPFKDTTFPFSAGFWIRRALYNRIGALAEDYPTNSDSEYVCRLRANKAIGWYSPVAGTVISADPTHAGGELDHVTARIKSGDRAASFRRMIESYSELVKTDRSAAYFLFYRYIKHASRAGVPPTALEIRDAVPFARERLALLLVRIFWKCAARG